MTIFNHIKYVSIKTGQCNKMDKDQKKNKPSCFSCIKKRFIKKNNSKQKQITEPKENYQLAQERVEYEELVLEYRILQNDYLFGY